MGLGNVRITLSCIQTVQVHLYLLTCYFVMIWFQLFVFLFLWHLGTHMLLPAHCMGFSISFAKTSWFRYPSCSSSYGHSVIHFEWCVWVTWQKTINAAAVWYEARKHIYHPFHLWMWLFTQGIRIPNCRIYSIYLFSIRNCFVLSAYSKYVTAPLILLT